jgi:dihydropteroate synthase
MRSIAIDLEASIHRSRQAGVQKHQLVIDPGLGFGKRKEQNAEIIANLRELQVFHVPILIGPSRKSFLRRDGLPETEFATAAAVTACIMNGAQMVRVHDVTAMKIVVETADAIRTAKTEEGETTPVQTRWQRGQ